MAVCNHCKSVQPITKHISECVTYPSQSYVYGNKCVGSYRADKSGRLHLVQVLNVLESGSFLLKYLAETQPRIIRRVMRELRLFRLAGFVFLFCFFFNVYCLCRIFSRSSPLLDNFLEGEIFYSMLLYS